MQRFYFVLFLVFFSIFPLFGHAQTPTALDPLEISIIPENPAPNQKVTINAESYSLDLSRSSLVWSIDGKTVQSGTGIKSISFQAPANGKKATINIYIKTAQGREVRKTVVIRPGDVSIAWEAQGYVPPLFKGKSLPSYQGTIRFVAIPELYKDNVRLNPQELIYTWKNGSIVIGSASGYGKQSINLSGTVVPEPMTVRVDVQSKDGLTRGAAVTTVDFHDPEIEFYKEDPLYGVLYNRALSSQEPLTNNEFKVVAAPYGFNDVGPYSWSINDNIQQNLAGQKSITFRNNGNTQGSTLIGLELRSIKNILQFARKDFTVYFNKRDTEQE